MDTEVTVQDLINTSFDQKPLDFENAFNTLMASRIAQAVDDKKIEVAQKMYGAPDEVEPEETSDEQPEEVDQEVTPEEEEDGETA